LQWKDTESAAAEYSHVMRYRDCARQSCLSDLGMDSVGAGVMCGPSVDAITHLGRRFSSPVRAACHAIGHCDAACTLPGQYLPLTNITAVLNLFLLLLDSFC